MKLHNCAKNILAVITFALILVSCIEGASNRKVSTGAVTDQSKKEGVHIVSTCSCKNGLLVDGTENCPKYLCIGSTQTFTEIQLTIGVDVYNPIYQKNGKTFSTQKLLQSVCTSEGYKCQIKIEELDYNSNAEGQINENRTEKSIAVNAASPQAQIIFDSVHMSKIRISNVLQKPINTLSFEILFKETNSYEAPVIYAKSDETPTINAYKGNGILGESPSRDLKAYNCFYAQQYGEPIKMAVSTETFNYENNEIPLYLYRGNYDAPFLCHQSSNDLTNLIQWNLTSWPPTLPLGYYERNSNPFPRLNNYFTGIRFWGTQSTAYNPSDDNLDFSESLSAKALTNSTLQYDIERRALEHFKKNEDNGEWIEEPLFSQFSYVRVPIINTNPIQLENVWGGFYMQPQPESSKGLRYTYSCPSKEMLLTADDGRLASIKKILSNNNGILKFSTKPFFAACAGRTSLDGQVSTLMRRIIYISYDDIIKIMQYRNPYLSLQQIHEKIFNRPASNSGEFFTLSELYKIKTNLNINLPAGGDINSMMFTLVSPEVVSSPKMDSQNNPTCLPNDVSKSSNSGYVFGCYPVLEN